MNDTEIAILTGASHMPAKETAYELFALQWPEPTCLVFLMPRLSASSHVMAQSATQLSDDILERENRCFVNGTFTPWRDGSQSAFDLLTEDATWTIVGTPRGGRYLSRARRDSRKGHPPLLCACFAANSPYRAWAIRRR
jgi:hypothetical protein